MLVDIFIYYYIGNTWSKPLLKRASCSVPRGIRPEAIASNPKATTHVYESLRICFRLEIRISTYRYFIQLIRIGSCLNPKIAKEL